LLPATSEGVAAYLHVEFLWFAPTDLPHNCSPTVNLETIAEALAVAEGEACK
jgi:hypothetical protein